MFSVDQMELSTVERPLILGSCVSRDIYNYYSKSEFEISEYYARTSLISLMSQRPSTGVGVRVENIKSAFQRRVVEFELTRDFRRRIPELEFDYLLMDFIDERHDVVEVEPGSYVTLTAELESTGFLDANPLLRKSVIQCGSVKHKLLWREALVNFIELCTALKILDKIVLNRTFWATEMDDGKDIPGTNPIYTQKNNAILNWMYHMITPMLDRNQIISVPSARLVSSAAHRWGPSPFHYQDGYYQFLKNRLGTK